ncbi:MAG: transposase [Syntrophobacteraceae bacterium]|nr:transposase [Syntrophobacteraceae bacterium]
MNPQAQDDWEIVLRFLPAGWEEKALELGALSRRRKIDSAKTLLRVLMIHLASGMSLRTTSAYAHEANLCSINDAALLHRLKVSEHWLHWMCVEILKGMNSHPGVEEPRSRFQVRVVDGAPISEPGSTGSDWRLHYCLRLDNLRCDCFRITNPNAGEDFQRFDISPGDLVIGERRYCKRRGITHVINGGGHVLVRFHSSNFPLFHKSGKPFLPLDHLRRLKVVDCGDWDVYFRAPGGKELQKGRLCAIKKTQEAAELARKRLRAKASKRQRRLLPETLEHAEYVCVFTTVNRHSMKTRDILELYREGWQIQPTFKRLKNIIGIGHIPKHNEESCIAWFYGKMVVAMLVEKLYLEAKSFSPWGYPIECPHRDSAQLQQSGRQFL